MFSRTMEIASRAAGAGVRTREATGWLDSRSSQIDTQTRAAPRQATLKAVLACRKNPESRRANSRRATSMPNLGALARTQVNDTVVTIPNIDQVMPQRAAAAGPW